MITRRFAQPAMAGLIMLALTPVSAWAEPPHALGPIVDVEVLLDGAWVTRKLDPARLGAQLLRVQEQAQETQSAGDWLWLAGLPGGIETDSLVLTADERALTTALRVEDVPVEQSFEYKRLASEIKAVHADMVRAQTTLERLTWQLGLLKQHAEDIDAYTQADEVPTALSDLIREKTRQRLTEQRLQQKLEILKQQQDEQRRVGSGYRVGLAIAEIEELLPKTEALALHYRVADAGWQPRYRAELDTERGEVVWSVAAEVAQNSGEDWPVLALQLATSDVQRYTPVPALPQQTVGLLPERAESQDAAPRAAMMAPALSSAAVEDSSGFATRLIPRQPTAIASGHPPAYLPIKEQQLDANWQVEVAPQVDTKPVVVARFTPKLDAALPAGHWRLFRDQQEQAGQHTDVLKPEREIAFSFGMDPRIEVNFEQRPDNRAVRGLVGRASQLERLASVHIHNHHQRRVPIEVVLQMPIPLDEDISVEAMSSTTNPSRRGVDGVENRWAYQRNLAADSSWDIDFSFRVRWPEDRLISPF